MKSSGELGSYQISIKYQFLKKLSSFDCVNIAADVRIFLLCLHQQTHKMHTSQQQNVI